MITAEVGSATATATAEKPKGAKKPRVGAQRAHVAPKKAKAAKKATLAKKAPKSAKQAGGARWQPHSVRGFLSGAVGKKMGLTVASTKGEDGERTYSLCGAPHKE